MQCLGQHLTSQLYGRALPCIRRMPAIQLTWGQYKAVACHLTDLLDVVLSIAICGQWFTQFTMIFTFFCIQSLIEY